MRGMYGYGFPGGTGIAGAGLLGASGFPWMAVMSWIIGIALIAAIIYFGIRTYRPAAPRKDGAFDILAGRFARGEISREEYLESTDFLKKN